LQSYNKPGEQNNERKEKKNEKKEKERKMGQNANLFSCPKTWNRENIKYRSDQGKKRKKVFLNNWGKTGESA
jgi:hypothetical protein